MKTLKKFIIVEYSSGDFGDLGNNIGTIEAENKAHAKQLFQEKRKLSDSEILYFDFI